jgi:hypothetical protein
MDKEDTLKILTYDELLKKYSDGNLSKEELLKELEIREQEEIFKINYELAKEHIEAAVRAMTGGSMEFISFNPALNIPYVSTGVSGALFELGNSIATNKNKEETLDEIKKGFVVGETIGSIPFIGKFLSKTKFGAYLRQQILQRYIKLFDSETWKNIVEFTNRVLLYLSKDVNILKNNQSEYLQNINNMLKYMQEDFRDAYYSNSKKLVQKSERGMGKYIERNRLSHRTRETDRESLLRSLSTYNSGRDGQRAYVRRSNVWMVNPNLEEVFKTALLPRLTINEYGQSYALEFYKSIKLVKDLDKARSAQVHLYSVDEYSKMRLFLSPNKDYGFAIKPDGDIVSVFVKPGLEGGIGHSLVIAAMSAGGKKLDAFDTFLYPFYTKHGFRRIGHSKWDDRYMPADWDKEYYSKYNNGEPDVVYMEQWQDPEAVMKSAQTPSALSLYDGTTSNSDEYMEDINSTNSLKNLEEKYDGGYKTLINKRITPNMQSELPAGCPFNNPTFLNNFVQKRMY